MALINGIYIHVTSEQVTNDKQVSTHSVETGISVTDNTKMQPVSIELEGKIVSYTEAVAASVNAVPLEITAWLSLVKRDGTAFDQMSFEYLDNELLHFEGGVNYVNTGAIQYLDDSGNSVDVSNGSNSIYQIKFEVKMPYEGKVRLQNNKAEYCAFNIINKSTTGYRVQDYNADEEVSSLVLSNTYNDQRGRIRTEFINYDVQNNEIPAQSNARSAAWVIDQLKSLQRSAAVITYDGRNYADGLQIENFTTTHTSTNAGGADFTMSLKEIRTAYNSYVQPDTAAIASGSTQEILQGDNSEVWYEVQVGDTIYGLVAADNAPYKDLKRPAIDGVEYSAVDWIMQKNPSAFSIPGKLSSFQAFKKIIVGYR